MASITLLRVGANCAGRPTWPREDRAQLWMEQFCPIVDAAATLTFGKESEPTMSATFSSGIVRKNTIRREGSRRVLARKLNRHEACARRVVDMIRKRCTPSLEHVC
jgi:hypothetical protein